MDRRTVLTSAGALALTALGAALAVAGCGGDDDDGGGPAGGGYGSPPASTATEATATEAPAAAKQQPGTEIEVGDSDYGRILFDGSDQAIYLFEKEQGSRSECYGACAEAWPPVLTDGDPVAAGGAAQKLLGTTERDDGSTQVTYAGHPLYYYVDDPKGEVLCQNVEEFGGLWLVVAPDGEAVR